MTHNAVLITTGEKSLFLYEARERVLWTGRGEKIAEW
jgi:hypothetical protein